MPLNISFKNILLCEKYIVILMLHKCSFLDTITQVNITFLVCEQQVHGFHGNWQRRHDTDGRKRKKLKKNISPAIGPSGWEVTGACWGMNALENEKCTTQLSIWHFFYWATFLSLCCFVVFIKIMPPLKMDNI